MIKCAWFWIWLFKHLVNQLSLEVPIEVMPSLAQTMKTIDHFNCTFVTGIDLESNRKTHARALVTFCLHMHLIKVYCSFIPWVNGRYFDTNMHCVTLECMSTCFVVISSLFLAPTIGTETSLEFYDFTIRTIVLDFQRPHIPKY